MICERHGTVMGIVCGEPTCGACFAEAAELVAYRPAKAQTEAQRAFLAEYYTSILFHGDAELFAASGIRT